MNERLQQVNDWQVLAKEAAYRRVELAALCQISVRTLERHFRKHYNIQVGKWLRESRLQEAYDELQKGKTVKEVAFGLGYKQLSHFSREFKKHFGVSPRLLLASPNGVKFIRIARLENPNSPQMVFAF